MVRVPAIMSGDVSGARHMPKWEKLLSALRRFTGIGTSENDAKQAICDGIADRAIEIRLELDKHTTKRMTARGKVLAGSDIEIPAHLEPRDLDFENSRPVKPWAVDRARNGHLAGYWSVAWIELSRTDVTKALISAGSGDEPATAKGPQVKSPQGRRKSRPGRDAARRAIAALYPDGVPDQVAMPNTTLCRRVGKKLKEMNLPQVSDETILRAADRRK